MFSWRHLKINLLLLLRLLALSALIMWCFSVRQKVASFGTVYIYMYTQTSAVLSEECCTSCAVLDYIVIIIYNYPPKGR